MSLGNGLLIGCTPFGLGVLILDMLIIFLYFGSKRYTHIVINDEHGSSTYHHQGW